MGYEAILVLYDKNVGTVKTLGKDLGDKFIDGNKKVCLDFANFVGGGNLWLHHCKMSCMLPGQLSELM